MGRQVAKVRNHFSISMVLVFIISLAFSLVLSISIMWCPQTLMNCLPEANQGYEHLEESRKCSPPEESDNTLDKDISRRNGQRSFSLNETPSFHVIAAAR